MVKLLFGAESCQGGGFQACVTDLLCLRSRPLSTPNDLPADSPIPMDMTNWAKVARELERGLPKSRNKRRCRLLPKILRDWSQTDLHEHLLLKSRTEIRAKIKKLETVKKMRSN